MLRNITLVFGPVAFGAMQAALMAAQADTTCDQTAANVAVGLPYLVMGVLYGMCLPAICMIIQACFLACMLDHAYFAFSAGVAIAASHATRPQHAHS